MRRCGLPLLEIYTMSAPKRLYKCCVLGFTGEHRSRHNLLPSDLTDWSVFEAAANDLDELTETVTSYISFCEDMCIPTRTHLTYNNDKPWFTAKLRQLRQAKEDAYRKGDKVLYKQAKCTLEKEIRVAKRNYSDKLKIQLFSSDSASVWKGLKEITNCKTPSPNTVENQQLAVDLNEFYCRFEKTPHTRSGHLSTQPLTPPATPLSPTPAIQFSEEDVHQVFRKQKRKKAPGQTVSHQPV